MSTAADGPQPCADGAPEPPGDVSLAVVAREWTRLGVTGFGGPPAHVALLRRLLVDRMRWMDAREFEDANAACGLLPGPASTQLAIFCAYRVAGPAGAVIGGLGFIVPAVLLVLALSELFLTRSPPAWVRGAGAGAGAAVAAVAAQAARGLLVPSLERARQNGRARQIRWAVYVAAAGVTAALAGAWVVLALLASGAAEYIARRDPGRPAAGLFAPFALVPAKAGLGALAWTAIKVGALSFGGGFVIIPLMQSDAVHAYHWMTNAQFLNAVALGQVTPGPVVATVSAVGFAAHGLPGGVLAAVVAFAPSFSFVLLGGGRFERIRASASARAFLDGAGPAAIGAILGAAIVLALALHEAWQWPLLAAAMVALLALGRGVVPTLLGAGAIGVLLALLGAPVPG
ncbi:MAG: chromate efflux transporter [Solirubrobacteraceae bacterium]